MKFLKNLIILPVIAVLLAVTAFAAVTADDIGAAPGDKAALTFNFNDVYNVDGAFAVSDPDGIVDTYTVSVVDAGTTLVTISGDRLWAQPGSEPVRTDVSIAVQISLKADAPVGAVCTVSFVGIYGDAGEAPGNEHDVYKAASLKVTEIVAQPPQTAAPGPETTLPKMDYRELEQQVAIANGLTGLDYTAETWDILSDALNIAQYALSSNNQSDVDTAARSLAEAISGLEKMDHTALKQALAAAGEFTGSDDMAEDWLELTAALEQAESLLDGNDQKAVDAAAERINELLAELKAQLDGLRTPEVVTKEVEVEVLPEDDFFNITSHRVWPLLFFVSLALNIALVVVIVAYTVKKKKYHNDDTPLVDYDIDDDI